MVIWYIIFLYKTLLAVEQEMLIIVVIAQEARCLNSKDHIISAYDVADFFTVFSIFVIFFLLSLQSNAF